MKGPELAAAADRLQMLIAQQKRWSQEYDVFLKGTRLVLLIHQGRESPVESSILSDALRSAVDRMYQSALQNVANEIRQVGRKIAGITEPRGVEASA